MQLRPAHPEDQVAIMALINAVYHEYGADKHHNGDLVLWVGKT